MLRGGLQEDCGQVRGLFLAGLMGTLPTQTAWQGLVLGPASGTYSRVDLHLQPGASGAGLPWGL